MRKLNLHESHNTLIGPKDSFRSETSTFGGGSAARAAGGGRILEGVEHHLCVAGGVAGVFAGSNEPGRKARAAHRLSNPRRQASSNIPQA